MLIDHLLEHVRGETNLVDENMIMDRPRGTLNGRMRVEVKVVLERVGNIALDESTWVRVFILITGTAREEANVMAFRSYHHNEFPLFLCEPGKSYG